MKKYFEFNKPFRKFLPLFTIMLSLVLLMSASYAMLVTAHEGENNYVIQVADLEVTFVDNETDALVLENAYPMTDKDGLSQTEELVFKVKNTGTIVSKYDVYIEGTTQDNIDFPSKIKFVTNKDNTSYKDIKVLSQDNYIDKGVSIEPNDSVVYRVKAWLDEDASSLYMNETYKAKIVINATQGE